MQCAQYVISDLILEEIYQMAEDLRAKG